MPRQIVSQDPVTRPATPERTYGDMRLMTLKTNTDGVTTRLKAYMRNYDEVSEEFDPDGASFLLMVDNLENQMTQSPRFEAAWDTINDILGLAYDFYRLREKVQEALDAGDDATALIAARNAALDALRAPLSAAPAPKP